MIRYARSLSRPRSVGAVLLVGALSATAACSSSTSNTASNNPPPSGGNSSAKTPVGNASLASAYKGTLASPDTTSRPAAKGKSVWIISGGQSSESSSVPVNAAKAAAEKLGWKVHIYAPQLNPANHAPGVSQAIAAHSHGIILDPLHC